MPDTKQALFPALSQQLGEGGTDLWEDVEFKNDGDVKLTQDTFVYKP